MTAPGATPAARRAETGPEEAGVWEDAARACALFAVDPPGLGGVALHALPGPVRDAWLALLADLLPPGTPVRRVPLNVSDGRLLGGLDLAATLAAGRPVAARGLLAEADGGVLTLAMAERLAGATAAHLTAALDAHEVVLERDGIAARTPTRFGVVALDERCDGDEPPPAALLERLAFHVDLEGVALRDTLAGAAAGPAGAGEIAAARAALPRVAVGERVVEALCATALALGVHSLRAPLLALRAARASAALAGRAEVADEDAAAAARLVLAPRATRLPAPDAEDPAEPPSEEPPEPPPEPGSEPPPDAAPDAPLPEQALEDMLLAAAQAALPADLLASLRLGRTPGGGRRAGRAGARQKGRTRGRPAGTRRGAPRAGHRLNVIETLRAAAPWQPLRRGERRGATAPGRHAGREAVVAPTPRIDVRPDDFRVTHLRQRAQTTTIFVVDASGSAALNRLAEAKGAVELLLADCYVRRDRVALIAFRGRAAELLLAPTRSLVRTKRSLAALPGGGGTPLAAAIEAARTLADQVRRAGDTPLVVLLTDGRANVALDGTPGRPQAEQDALAAASRFAAGAVATLLIDVSPQPQPRAAELAVRLGARYLPLPYADARGVQRAVQAAAPRR